MSRAAKVGRAARKPAVSVLSLRDCSTLKVAKIRLDRANDVLNAIHFCAEADAELNLGALAIAARDLIDSVIRDLVPLGGVLEECS
jgi:hypothetical protein